MFDTKNADWRDTNASHLREDQKEKSQATLTMCESFIDNSELKRESCVFFKLHPFPSHTSNRRGEEEREQRDLLHVVIPHHTALSLQASGATQLLSHRLHHGRSRAAAGYGGEGDRQHPHHGGHGR